MILSTEQCKRILENPERAYSDRDVHAILEQLIGIAEGIRDLMDQEPEIFRLIRQEDETSSRPYAAGIGSRGGVSD
jgi:hypothetical protein